MEWKELFPQAWVSHLQASYSNHVPILLTTHPLSQQNRVKKIPRRFEEKWVTYDDCEAVIQQVWTNTVTTGSPMYCLFEKIKQCRSALVGWSRVTFGQSKSKIQEKQRL